MKKYRFYIAWLAFSGSACGEDTKVNRVEDLVPQFKDGNENVNTYEFEAVDDKAALDKSYAWAFHNNFTGEDTVTDLECLDD